MTNEEIEAAREAVYRWVTVDCDQQLDTVVAIQKAGEKSLDALCAAARHPESLVGNIAEEWRPRSLHAGGKGDGGIEMKKYQPVLTEDQRFKLLDMCKNRARENPMEPGTYPALVDALRSAPEYLIGRRVRCKQPGIVEPKGRIVAPVWDVENDNGGHTYVREGEFEFLPKPEGTELVGKNVKIREMPPNASCPARLYLQPLSYTDDKGNGIRAHMRTSGGVGEIIFYSGEDGFDHDRLAYKVLFGGGTWGWFARDEFDLIDPID